MLGERGLDIIGQIYEAAHDSSGWTDVLVAVADYCGGANVALVVIDKQTDYYAVNAPRADPGIITAYEKSWWQHDPTVAATARFSVGQTSSLQDTGREVFFGSAFYNDFWRCSGLGSERLACNLSVRDGFFASAVLQTSTRRDEVDADMAGRFSLFVPHLIRSVEMANRYRRLQFENLLRGAQACPDTIGRLVVDREMRLLFADAGGETYLGRSGGFRLRSGMLSLTDWPADKKLALGVARIIYHGLHQTQDTHVSMACPQTQRTVVIEIQPVHHALGTPGRPFMAGSSAAAILSLSYQKNEQQAASDSLRSRFGLTPAEAALAFEMLAGDGREAAARRCGISINTARTHLTRIFDKTGVRRQAELVALVNRVIWKT